MNAPSPANELQEVQLREPELKRLSDISLPAEQVITEQCEDAEEQLAPRFIP